MRKAILIALVVLFIVIGGGASVLWFLQAKQIKQNVVDAIASINAKQPYITYESIETSGFPSDVIVSIIKPHITGRVDTFMNAIAAAQRARPPVAGMPSLPPTTTPALPEWNEDWLLDGAISLGINAFSDHYTMGISGNWHGKSKIGDATTEMATQSTGSSVCSLKLEHGTSLMDKFWNFNAIMGNRDFAQDFRTVDCVFPGYTTVDATSQAPLISSGGGRLYITNDPRGTARQVRVYVKTTDAIVAPAGDKIAGAYFQLLLPNMPIMAKLSSYGKQNLEADVSYSGPASLRGDIKSIPLEVNISKLTITNDMYNGDATLHLTNSVTGDNRMVKLVFNITSNFTEQYDALLKDMTHQLMDRVYANPNDPQLAKFKPITDSVKREDLNAALDPALPNLHGLGKLTQSLDLSYQGRANTLNGDISLANLELSATPYGISGKGSAKATQGNPIPALNLTLNCTNCAHLIDDVTDYATRLVKAAAVLNPQQAIPAPRMDPTIIKGFKDFMGALATQSSDAASQSVYTYTIQSDGTPNITVNGKKMGEVMMLFNQYMAPVMQQPAPAAATPQR